MKLNAASVEFNIRRCATWPLMLFALHFGVFPAAAQTGDEWQATPWQLWRIDVDGGNLRQLSHLTGSRCGSPDWSPDGQFVAFDTIRADQAWDETQIAVMRADGSDLHLIGRGAVPSWSPDGTMIVFQSHDPPHRIFVMNRDGTGRELIADHGWSARWSPVGNRIAMASANVAGILLFDLSSGQETEIVSGPYAIRHGFSISPDGSRICFSSAKSPGQSVATLDASAQQTTVNWPLRSGVAYHSSWSPDDHHVVFAWRPTDRDIVQLYIMDVDSPDAPQLLPGQDHSRHNVNPDWSPDGKTIVFSSPDKN